jgi:hypothetical protein
VSNHTICLLDKRAILRSHGDCEILIKDNNNIRVVQEFRYLICRMILSHKDLRKIFSPRLILMYPVLIFLGKYRSIHSIYNYYLFISWYAIQHTLSVYRATRHCSQPVCTCLGRRSGRAFPLISVPNIFYWYPFESHLIYKSLTFSYRRHIAVDSVSGSLDVEKC